jgi:hypothetical protein
LSTAQFYRVNVHIRLCHKHGAFRNDDWFELNGQTAGKCVRKMIGTWVESGPIASECVGSAGNSGRSENTEQTILFSPRLPEQTQQVMLRARLIQLDLYVLQVIVKVQSRYQLEFQWME